MNLFDVSPIILAATLAGCAAASSEFGSIDTCLESGQAWNYRQRTCQPAPNAKVELIRIDKSARMMAVYRQGRLIREFRVALGRGGLEPKARQGDGRVPEGSYRIVAHNPNSAFHLSLRIGYPTPKQAAAAKRIGIDPGSHIMIHGLPNGRGAIGSRHTLMDWTEGCVAVTNREMDWLYAAVADGTPVQISA